MPDKPRVIIDHPLPFVRGDWVLAELNQGITPCIVVSMKHEESLNLDGRVTIGKPLMAEVKTFNEKLDPVTYFVHPEKLTAL